MATERDLNVSLHKKETNEVLNLYPETKTENVHVTDEQTLDKYLSLQNKINESYSNDSKKLSNIDEGAQKNQNAFSAVKSGNFLVEADKEKDALELVAGSNISIDIINDKVTFSAGKTDVTKADATTDGLMSSKDYKKLQNIEEGANNYTHPSSGVVPDTYIRVTVDKNGHVTKGNNDVLKISEGGTGVSTLLELKNLLGSNEIDMEYSVKENSSNPVTSSGIYKALQEKANTNHGNHVPDSSDSPDSFSFLKEGNVWESIPDGNTSKKGVVQLTNEIGESESLAVSQKGLKTLSETISTKIDNLKGNPESGLDTLEKLATQVKANSSELSSHIGNTTVHITADERKKWNAKSDVKLDTELSNTSTNAISNKAVTEALSSKANSSDLSNHTGNNTIHITDAERTKWNAKSDVKLDTELSNTSTNAISNKAVTEAITSHTGNSSIHITDAERTKWNNAAAGTVTVDSALSSTSENPVQNKVVNSALSSKANSSKLTSHTGNTTVHITADERTKWNGILEKAKAYTDEKYGSIDKMDFYVIESGTHESITSPSKSLIYLEKASSGTQYESWIYRDKWMNIGSDDLNLDNYYNKTEVVNLINNSKLTVDSALSSTSENPVQNKVVKTELDKKASSETVTSHIGNNTIHITADERKKWNAKSDVKLDTELSNTSTNAISNKAVTEALSSKANSSDLSNHTGNTSYHVSEEDRKKWNNAAAGTVTVDSALSSTSENPIQNKVVNSALSSKANSSDLSNHTGNNTIHITDAERTKWNAKSDVKLDTELSNTSTNAISNKAVTEALGSKANSSDLTNKVDKVTGKGLSTNDFTNALKSNYDSAYSHSTSSHAPSNAERNVIVGIQKNGTDLTPNTSTRKVNITVPTKVSELTNDSKYITEHPTVGTDTDTTSSKSINITTGDSFDVVDSVTRDSNGHVTKINVKTVTVSKHDNSGGGVVRSTTAPTDTTVLWIDISGTDAIPKYYNGTAWVILPAVWG